MPGRWWIFAIVISVCGSLFAQDKMISSVSVDAVLSDPPVVEYKKSRELAPKNAPENRWLIVKIEYTVKLQRSKPNVKLVSGVYQVEDNGFIDDLQLQLTVLKDSGLTVAGKSLWAKYTGKTSFYYVRRDGKKRVALMFIPAKVIDRFSWSSTGNVRKSGKGDFKVEAVLTVSGKELSRVFWGVAGTREFYELSKMVPGNMIVEGGVVPRSQTPWAMLGTENFDMEK